MICPECQSQALTIERSLELPPDGDNDEITLQTVACAHCGFQALALYRESRRGALDSESWVHEGLRVSPEDFQAISDMIEGCPQPAERRCHCLTHQRLGRMSGYRWDGLRLIGVEILGYFAMIHERQ